MRLVLPLAAVAVTASIASLANAQEAAVRLEDDPERGALTIVVGPVDLPAPDPNSPAHAEGHHGAHAPVWPPITTVRVPRSVYLKGFSYDVVDGAGNPLPTGVLHHLNLINPDNRELFLPISQRMLAVGKETGEQSMPGWLLGYPVAEGTPMVVSVMLHNPTGAAQQDVEVRVRLDYVEAGRPWPLFSVYPFQLDVAFPAGDKSVDLPPGTSEFAYEASPAVEGRLMVIGGHLHEYATSLRFEDVTEGRVLWEGKPVYDEGGVLKEVTLGRLYRTLGVKLHPDRRYRVVASYHNTTADTLYDGGMGVVGGVFMPSGGKRWPRADKSDELYVLDRMHYLQDVRGRFDAIKDVVVTGEVPPAEHSHGAGGH